MKMSGETAKSGDSSEISDKECYSLEFKVSICSFVFTPLDCYERVYNYRQILNLILLMGPTGKRAHSISRNLKVTTS